MADEETTQTEDQKANANLEQLRKKAERADELEAKLALRDKQDAFRAANIDPEAGVGKLVWDSFKAEGEVTPDSVRAFAEQYGITPGAPAPEPSVSSDTPTPNMSDAERAHFAMVNQPGSIESAPDAQGPIGDRAYKAFMDEKKAGMRSERAAVAGLDVIFGAANNGDRSVVYNQAEWRRQHGG
jgi:hypothetical protein